MENGRRYWYDNGVKAVSKEVYDRCKRRLVLVR